ncbi:hypothetical protein U3516DRAFT_746338, partial [Neocallimastix sp. 'constans']
MGDLRLSSPPYNMSIYLTAILVRCRRSQSPISKETPVYIREPQGKAEPTIRAGNCNPLRQGLHNGTLKVFEIFKNEKD